MRRIRTWIVMLGVAAAVLVVVPVASAGPTYQLHYVDIGGAAQTQVDKDRDGVFDSGDYMTLNDQVAFVDGSPVADPRLFGPGSLSGRLTALGGDSARADVSLRIPAGSIAVRGVFSFSGQTGFVASAFGTNGLFKGMTGTVDIVFNSLGGPDLYVTLR